MSFTSLKLSKSIKIRPPKILCLTDEKNNIIKVNQAFCQILGYSKEELIGQNPRIFKTAHQDKTLVEDIWNNLKINGTWSGDVYNKKSNGDLIALRSTITAIKIIYYNIRLSFYCF